MGETVPLRVALATVGDIVMVEKGGVEEGVGVGTPGVNVAAL